jgi:hypothetical protein
MEEELKQRVKATVAKIRRYDDREKRYQQNRRLENNQKIFYKDIQNNLEVENEIPDAEESKDFWTGIWGQAIEHDGTAPWIDRVTRKLEGRRQEEIIIIWLLWLLCI